MSHNHSALKCVIYKGVRPVFMSLFTITDRVHGPYRSVRPVITACTHATDSVIDLSAKTKMASL